MEPGTEARVRRILEELDYRPNIFAKNLRLGRKFTFGALMPKPSQDGTYWTLPVNGMNRARNELLSQKVDVRFFFYDKYSELSFRKAGGDVRRAGLDGLLIAPVVSRMSEEFLAEVPDGLPYIFFDSFIPKAGYLSYIGQDAFQSGVLSARLMTMLVQGGGAVAVLRVLPQDYHIDGRVDGFLSFCRRAAGLETRVYEIDGNKGQERVARVLGRAFADHRDLRGIFVTNAATHRAAAYVRSRRSGAGRPRIIGYDLIAENVRYLREGVIDFLISQQPERQGYEGVYALYRHVVLKEPVEKKVMMPLDIVTSENLDYYQG